MSVCLADQGRTGELRLSGNPGQAGPGVLQASGWQVQAVASAHPQGSAHRLATSCLVGVVASPDDRIDLWVAQVVAQFGRCQPVISVSP